MTANNDNDRLNKSVNTEKTLATDTNMPIADHGVETKQSGENELTAPNHDKDPLTALNQRGDGGRLELLEERPVINKERLDVGKVTVTKHSRTKTIQVPIELIEEYITVRTEYHDAESQDLLSGNYDDKDILRHVEPALDSRAVITINDKQVEIGDEPVEIILSRQVATITKDTYVIQEVDVNKSTHTHTDRIKVELKHEELEVTEEGFLEHERTPIHKK
ncbi:YsnF/AvaK domain-containing protein [Psychrobacter sp. Pi2-51]|uniref:YsnF/AvaK domain-containing protein n=1 Tax=Psychrobacter sp. Pi2-51 TaxID=2774132 RepID=UPI001918124C|nr:DUF2382 domain-containing protein [Psychrobacter sp. Pi2-51]